MQQEYVVFKARRQSVKISLLMLFQSALDYTWHLAILTEHKLKSTVSILTNPNPKPARTVGFCFT